MAMQLPPQTLQAETQARCHTRPRTGTTTMLAPGTNGQVLTLSGGVHTWAAVSGLESDPVWLNDKGGNTTIGGNWTFSNIISGSINGNAATATNIAGGAAGSLPYQTAANTTGMLAVGNNGDVLTLAGGVPTWAAPTSSGWSLTGNSGTTAGTNFLGTTDDVSLNFRVNNTKAGHIGNNTDNSVFLGLQAGFNDDGTDNRNTFIGTQAGYSNTTGYENTANGYMALYSNTTGNYNVALGRASGFGATGISFNQCTFVGASSFPTVARTNVTMLGYGITNAECTGDNQVLLGNTAITQIRAQVGTITTYSDKRFKTNIAEDVKGLDFITRLRPVSYNENPEILHQIWETPDSLVKEIDHSQIKNTRFVGLIAQEVNQAMKESGYTHFPGIDIPRNEHETYSLRYGDFIMPMIKAIQELKQENNTLKQENKHLKDRINKIEELLKVKSNFNPTHQE